MYGSRLGASHRLIAPRFGPRRHSPPEHKLSELAPPETAGAAHDAALATHVDIIGAYETRAKGNGDLDQSNGIDKSALAIATPRGIVTASTFAMLPNKRISFAAASNRIRIIFATCNRGRLAAK
jgi:hypothetical protein